MFPALWVTASPQRKQHVMSVIIEDSHQKGVTVFNHGDSGSTGTKTCPEAFSLMLLTLGAIGVWVQPPGALSTAAGTALHWGQRRARCPDRLFQAWLRAVWAAGTEQGAEVVGLSTGAAGEGDFNSKHLFKYIYF